MEIQIWSDVVCPWCYIGTTNLRAALGDTIATVHFRSYQLDPAAPATPVRTIDYLGGRFGDSAGQMLDHVTEVASRAGLEYHLRDSWSGQTLAAHRLLHLAADHGQQEALAMRFFAAQFTEGRSLFDEESLVALCDEAGVDTQRARAVLQADEYRDAVARDIDQARAYGVTGVPFFVFNDRLAVSGAQPVEVFQQALQQA